MRPIQLRLKGFKGIKAGMVLDEVTVNFKDLNGVVVFSAPNGSGKTTILDNAHPYRIMPYRAGNSYRPTAFSYYDHTFGDAEKEFIFEIDGIVYKSRIVIDTDRKKAEAYLHTQCPDGEWAVYPGIDGKLEPYDRAVEEVLGSPELFFTSIFRAQNAKALSDYSKGDIKDLFVELLNISHLQAIGEKARRVKQDLAGKVDLLMVERKRLQDIASKESETRENITTVQADIIRVTEEIASHEQEIITLQELINEVDVKINLQNKAKEQIDKIEAELNTASTKYATMSETAKTKGLDLSTKVTTLQGTIKTAEALVATLPTLRPLSQEKTEKETALESTKADIGDIDSALAVMNQNLNTILAVDTTIARKESDLSAKQFSRKNLVDALERDLKEAKKQAEYIKSSGCPVDNPTCKFMKAAVEKRDRISGIERDIATEKNPTKAETDLQAEIKELKAKKTDPASMRTQIATITNTKTTLAASQKTIETRLQDIAKALEGLPLAEQAEKQLPDLRTQLTATETERDAYAGEINKELVALKETIDELTAKVIDATDPVDHTETKKTLTEQQADYRTKIEDARTRDADHRKHLGALEETLKQVDQAKGRLDTIGSRITYLNDEISQWSTLEKAFGNDGIIALELDDAGPQISAIANELLQVFGGRFAVRIDTQSAKAAGGMKEVFDITVFDNQTNEQKSIKRLSGGERTWIEDALTKSIAIYNVQSSGHSFKTLFSDEKDGALDAEKKTQFWQMKRRVLELGGYDREICITQSPALIGMADHTIELGKDGVNIREN